MKNYYDVSVTEMEKSVHQILECQQNNIKIESNSAQIESAMLKAMLDGIDAIERILRC
jgi:hypothetical protein